MLIKYLLPAVAAFSGLSTTVAWPTRSIIHHEDGQVEIAIEGRDLETRRIYLKNWSGCSNDQKDQIVSAWNNMLDMARKVRGTIDFNEVVAHDFFGPPDRNDRYQDAIREMIDEVTSWEIGSFIDWHLEMTCDDPVRAEDIARQKHELRCPKGTADADQDKCSSHCWQYYTNSDGSVREWFSKAAAYTTNWPSVHVGRVNWCPAWFNDLKPCLERYEDYSKRTGASKQDISNYQCREQAMVHELFHLDVHPMHHSKGKFSHIYDRKINITDKAFGGQRTVLANGPLYTKVLANYERNRGFFAATNADNLAFYFLGKWIMHQGGYYPHDPITHDKPLDRPSGSSKRDDTKDVWDPIEIDNNQITFGDVNDLAEALDTTTDKAVQMYEVVDSYLDCGDLASSDDNSTVTCYTEDSDKNDPVDLDASLGYPTEVEEPAPTTTTTPIGPLRTCNPIDVQHGMTYEQASNPIALFCGDDGYLMKIKAQVSYQDFAAKEQVFGFAEGASKYHVHLRIEGSNATLGDGCQNINYQNKPDNSKEYCSKQLYSVLNGCGAFVQEVANWKVGGTLDESCLKWTLERRSIDTGKYPDCKGSSANCCEKGCDVVN